MSDEPMSFGNIATTNMEAILPIDLLRSAPIMQKQQGWFSAGRVQYIKRQFAGSWYYIHFPASLVFWQEAALEG